MWVIFILSFIAFVFVAVLILVAAAWIIHKVSNAIIRDNKKLEKEIAKED